MNISKPDNCGNSPKNAFLEDFIYALLNHEPYKEKLAENAKIEILGANAPGNLETLTTLVENTQDLAEVQILDAISHGKKGAVDIKILTIKGTEKNIGIFFEFKSQKPFTIGSMKIVLT